MLELILCQDVASLGKSGQVVKVTPGYARNFLLPRKLACVATSENLKRIEQQKVRQQAEYEKAKKVAEALAEKLMKLSCTVVVEVNDLDKLYGAVTEAEIAQALDDEGYKIDRKAIELEKPIETLGIFEVNVRLHPDVVAKIRLWVAKK